MEDPQYGHTFHFLYFGIILIFFTIDMLICIAEVGACNRPSITAML